MLEHRYRRRWRCLLRNAGVFVVIVLIFGVGLVVFAYRIPSRQFQPTSRFDPSEIEVNEGEVGEVLAEFLSILSCSYEDRTEMNPDDFYQLHEILQHRFPSAHHVLDREAVNDLSLLYRWKGRDASLEPILLMSHLDVVPIEKQTLCKYSPC